MGENQPLFVFPLQNAFLIIMSHRSYRGAHAVVDIDGDVRVVAERVGDGTGENRRPGAQIIEEVACKLRPRVGLSVATGGCNSACKDCAGSLWEGEGGDGVARRKQLRRLREALRPSPVRHEGRIGVTVRDDGPVPLGSPTLSEAHARIARTPAITPRPSVDALHAFAPPNPSPLANQSFERLATSSVDPRRRDTVVSIGDTESLIGLYVHSPGPTHTVPAACSFIHGNDESDH
ncbi:hypothetical protein B0F90DRAFT_1669318 [Multifurca ochricompacta]|uniref:Uncharacterized protein n=1 Tax=Multifurca ochricompacta TaxID=376703 RepID=A0AAD4QJD1_9AGAM|nr:hypothetical protein B0F90DRAFT_1669318 [Multifurca ochricompacta]